MPWTHLPPQEAAPVSTFRASVTPYVTLDSTYNRGCRLVFGENSNIRVILFIRIIVMWYNLNGGRPYRQIARDSSESGRCSRLGVVENHVSISRTKLKNLEKRKDDWNIKKKQIYKIFPTFVFVLHFSYFLWERIWRMLIW